MDQPAAGPTHPGAEHRLVTIFFADVVGSTALTAETEAETSRLIFDRCLRIMSRSVDEFGGTVARLMGDGLLAFFGAPTSHEDDPERAVLAALDLHEEIARYGKELNIPLQVRVGINTGRVVMGEVGGESLSEYTAMGQPINLAARLQSSAEPGTTLIGETTGRLVAHSFETRALTPLALKGFDEPVPAFQLVKQRDRAETARGIPGLRSPLIGRERELESMGSMLQDLQAGRGAILSLVGEPGVGKSRLVDEARANSVEAPISWAHGQASSYTSDQPFSVIRELLRDLLHINVLDSPALMDLKIEKELAPLFGEKLEEVWPHIALLLGAPMPPQYADRIENLEPEALHRGMISAFCQLVEALAVEKPRVLAFDDLHWADPSSIDVLESLFLVTERAALLIVLIFRPDHESRVWELKIRAERDFGHRYQSFSLAPLTPAESRRLTACLLSNESMPETVHELLLEKSEGNPFYIEELLQELMESGTFVERGGTWELSREIQNLRVPETLQEVVQARVDRLPVDERITLQSAAVIGRRFGYRLLEAVTPHADKLPSQLLTLQRADLIREWSRQPEPTYNFKQSAVQEVTYQQLLSEQRRILHHKVAQALEVIFEEQIDEHAAMLAHHFSQAADEPKALQYHRMAGDKAFQLNANREAAGHFTRAIELAQAQEESIERLSHLYFSLGRVYELLADYDEALKVYDKLSEVAELHAEPKLELRARLAKNTLRVTPTPLFEAVEGRRMSEEALQLARELNDPEAEAKTLWHLGLLGRLTARDAEAIEFFEQSLAIAEEHGLEEQIAFTLTDLYWSYLVKGNADTSQTTIERAHEIWTRLGNLPMMVDTLAGKVFVLGLAGDFQGAIKSAQEALALSEKIDNLWGRSYSQLYLGFIRIELGEIGLAFETMQRSMELGKQAGFFVPGVILPAIRAITRARLGGGGLDELLILDSTPGNFKQIVAPLIRMVEAEICIHNGDLDRAAKLLEEESDEMALMSTIYLEFPIEGTKTRFALATGKDQDALEITTEAIDNLGRRGMVCHLPIFYHLRAMAHEKLGNLDEALADVNLGLAFTANSGARWPTWQLLGLRAHLYNENGEMEKAAEDLRGAVEVIQFIADQAGDESLRQAFLSKSEVKAMLAGSPPD